MGNVHTSIVKARHIAPMPRPELLRRGLAPLRVSRTSVSHLMYPLLRGRRTNNSYATQRPTTSCPEEGVSPFRADPGLK